MIPFVSGLDWAFCRNMDNLPTFTGTELFHVYDVFEEEYIAEVIQKKGRPQAILSDRVLYTDPKHVFSIEYYALPLWPMRECRYWTKKDFDDDQELVTDYAFNFMVNKKQCSRYILIKLVEIGGYKNFQYTWSGVGREFDMRVVIEEMDSLADENPVGTSDFRSKILSPIVMPARYIDKNSQLNPDEPGTLTTKHGYGDYGGTRWTWNAFLSDMFSRSAVSLISETGRYMDIAAFSEKSLYAFFGLTFPIWVGNYGQAHAIEQVGLDVFHDVIDHDYQWYPTLIERCYWAFELNKKILHDLDHAKKIRESQFDRLLRNRHFLLEDGLATYCVKKIGQFPPRYREAMMLIKEKYDFSESDCAWHRPSSRSGEA